MIRKFIAEDIAEYKAMCRDFYDGNAVLKPVPNDYFDKTIAELLRSDTYAKCFIIEHNSAVVGYGLISRTFSQEAGGLVVWLEELYIKPQYRGLGLGREFFDYVLANEPAARYRLETEKDNDRARSLYYRLGFEDFPYTEMKKGG